MPSRSPRAGPLPICDSTEPIHDYYYRHMFPRTALILEPRAMLDVWLDWLLSRAPAVPNAAPIVEPDCVVLAQSSAQPPQPPRVPLTSRRLVLAFIVCLALAAVLSRRSLWWRLSKGWSRQHGHDIADRALDLIAAAWALILSVRLPLWRQTTTRGIQTFDRPDQDTWLRRFTSTRPPSKENSVRLPPDWHDWFKRSPPKPTGAPLTPPLPIVVLPLPRSPRTPRPTPLTPAPANRRRVALRPKASRAPSPESSSSSSSEDAPSRAFARMLDSRRERAGGLLSPADYISRDEDDFFDYELLKASVNDDSDFEPIVAVPSPSGASLPQDIDTTPVAAADEPTDAVAAVHEDEAAFGGAAPPGAGAGAESAVEDDAPGFEDNGSDFEDNASAGDAAPSAANDPADPPKKKKTRRSGRKWKRRLENAAEAHAVAAMLQP